MENGINLYNNPHVDTSTFDWANNTNPLLTPTTAVSSAATGESSCGGEIVAHQSVFNDQQCHHLSLYGGDLPGRRRAVLHSRGGRRQRQASRPPRPCLRSWIRQRCICHKCTPKIIGFARRLKGVETVTMDKDKNKLTVIGEVEPLQIQDALRRRTKKKVDIVSAQPTRANANSSSGKKSQPRDDKKSNQKKPETDNKPQEAPMTTAVFKMPLPRHIDKSRKTDSRIKGVRNVGINRKKDTVTVKGTTDGKKLKSTLRKRLKNQRLSDKKKEQKCSLRLESKAYLKRADLPWSIPASPPPNNPASSPHSRASPSTADEHTGLCSETCGEYVGWIFLILNLILEGVSAVLDQKGYILPSMVLAFVALLVFVIELLVMSQQEGPNAFDGSSCLPSYYRHGTNTPQTNELFFVFQCFGLLVALWQCLYSTIQYIYALRQKDNPIKMTLLPFIFLLCVLISKLVSCWNRKFKANNGRNVGSASDETESQSYHDEPGGADSPLPGTLYEDQGQENGSGRWRQGNDQPLERMKDEAWSDTIVDPFNFKSGEFGCKHYRRRCKIRAPCCSEIFSCWSCHDEAKVICALCQTEQDVQQNCINCGVCMGKYFCSKCKTFDDDVSKNQYHCDECGICRNGGRCTECGKQEINQQS